MLPGLIDPHIHLLGGRGESGFSTRTPEFHLGEVVRCGITTVVGVMGLDTTMTEGSGVMAATSRRGRMLVIGGAEDSDEKDRTILPHRVEIADRKT